LEFDRRDFRGLETDETLPTKPHHPPDEKPRLTFEQLIHGLSWLLRGTSERRADLCFRCFEEPTGGVQGPGSRVQEPTGGVSRARFASLLLSVYLMYHASWPIDEAAYERLRGEAEQFSAMMFDLWDEGRTGRLSHPAFDRAAHQHPLLIQAFQLEQLDLPPSALSHPEPPSPLGSASLRGKNGVYLGLRPGALSRNIDDSYF